jgi:hypothetical protein
MPIDALRRFTPIPLESTFVLRGSIFSVATNCQVLADRMLGALTPPAPGLVSAPAFVWKVVVEAVNPLEEIDSLTSHRLSHNGLAFVSIGRKSFLACDLQAHEGVAFVSRRLVDNENVFQEYFLPPLISLLKESLSAPS